MKLFKTNTQNKDNGAETTAPVDQRTGRIKKVAKMAGVAAALALPVAAGINAVNASGESGADTPVREQNPVTTTTAEPEQAPATTAAPEQTTTTIEAPRIEDMVPSATLEIPEGTNLGQIDDNTFSRPDGVAGSATVETREPSSVETEQTTTTEPLLQQGVNPGQINENEFSNPDGVAGSATTLTR